MQLINLIVIFLTLAYLLPRAAMYFPAVGGNIHYYNLLAGVCVYIVMFLYNFVVNYTGYRRDLTLTRNIMDSLIKGVMVIAAYYVYEELHKHYQISLPMTPDEQRALLVILVLLSFILLNSIIRA
jgi:hypothetical protein